MTNDMENKDFIGTRYETDAQYGLSKFQLTTYDGNTPIKMVGLLNDLPEFSFSVDYTDGPGSTWQDMLSSFMSNDLVQLINAVGANGNNSNWRNFIKAGSWTKKIYNGYKPGTITLKFRIYDADTLGQTPAKIWMSNLQKFASANADNQYSSARAIENIAAGLGNIASTGSTAGDIIKLHQGDHNSTPDEDKNRIKSECDMKRMKTERFITLLYGKICRFSGDKVVAYRKDSQFSETDLSVGNLNTGNNSYSVLYYIRRDNKTRVYIGINTAYNQNTLNIPYVHDHDYINKNYGSDEDPNDILGIDDIVSDFTQASSKITDPEIRKAFNDDILTKVRTLAEEMDTTNTNAYTDMSVSSLREKVFELQNVANELETGVIGKYGPYRVASRFNRENSFGAKLWYLNIYDDNNVIFNSAFPLIVYISNWTVKFSEESNISSHVYHEFSVTCNLDQTYSRTQWYRILSKDVTNNSQDAWVKDANSKQFDPELKKTLSQQ
jgi:hypothetical protein